MSLLQNNRSRQMARLKEVESACDVARQQLKEALSVLQQSRARQKALQERNDPARLAGMLMQSMDEQNKTAEQAAADFSTGSTDWKSFKTTFLDASTKQHRFKAVASFASSLLTD